jgi:orotate phosphoribosyltransferase
MLNLKKALAKKLLAIEAVKLRDQDHLFTWTSGIKSPIYCDNRLTISYPEIRDMIAEGLKELIINDFPEVDIVAATATAGIPHGAWVADRLNKPMVYVRSKTKKHGRENKIEGHFTEGQTVVLIEDLISTGKSSLEAVEALRDSGLIVKKVYAIFTYDFDLMKENFKEQNVAYETLLTYDEMLALAVETDYIDEETKEILSKWSKNPKIFTDSV